jgi:phosphosulfolactate synthase (CoM biosynthesis protein A)
LSISAHWFVPATAVTISTAPRTIHDFAGFPRDLYDVKSWRTDVPAKFVNALGLEKVMFEAAEPEVFQWYIKNYGPEG